MFKGRAGTERPFNGILLFNMAKEDKCWQNRVYNKQRFKHGEAK
jgi:hypothetical protein